MWASFVFPKLAPVFVLRAFFLWPDCEILPKTIRWCRYLEYRVFLKNFFFKAEVEITNHLLKYLAKYEVQIFNHPFIFLATNFKPNTEILQSWLLFFLSRSLLEIKKPFKIISFSNFNYNSLFGEFLTIKITCCWNIYSLAGTVQIISVFQIYQMSPKRQTISVFQCAWGAVCQDSWFRRW